MDKFLDNKYYIVIMTLVTIYALFADDMRQLTTDKVWLKYIKNF